MNDCHCEGLGPPAPAGHLAVPVDSQSHCNVLTGSVGLLVKLIDFLGQVFSKQDVPTVWKDNVNNEQIFTLRLIC